MVVLSEMEIISDGIINEATRSNSITKNKKKIVWKIKTRSYFFISNETIFKLKVLCYYIFESIQKYIKRKREKIVYD
ncbi:hypothetical protein TEHSL10_03290 [Tetragenococcus halophilus]|nr:hypothetical protein TEHSL10_03290 [Tetragenococcus halophilus]